MALAVGISNIDVLIRRHLPYIPKFDRLIFSIWDEVATISTGINESDAFYMSHQDSSSFPFGCKATPVPNLKGAKHRSEDIALCMNYDK